jgi:uncharacterized protein
MAERLTTRAVRVAADDLSGALGPQRHRPYPAPRRPWIMKQTWRDLLFAHWPLAISIVRSRVPAVLPLDTYDDLAWIGITPFRLSGLRPRFLPPFPGVSNFPELNVRTYVTVDGKPGVYFFSLDAGSAIAVAMARLGYRLPYFTAEMSHRRAADWVTFRSHRTHAGAPHADFQARFRPAGEARRARKGSLEYFLTERYCLYTVTQRRTIYRAEIHHAPWPLQKAEAEIGRNTMAAAAGFGLPDTPPLLYFSSFLDVHVWAPERA